MRVEQNLQYIPQPRDFSHIDIATGIFRLERRFATKAPVGPAPTIRTFLAGWVIVIYIAPQERPNLLQRIEKHGSISTHSSTHVSHSIVVHLILKPLLINANGSKWIPKWRKTLIWINFHWFWVSLTRYSGLVLVLSSGRQWFAKLPRMPIV